MTGTASPKDSSKNFSQATRVTQLGRDPHQNYGVVNPPVYHASTILFDTVEEMEARAATKFEKGTINYGRQGTPTIFALENAVADLEGGYGAFAVSSGLGAITTAILSVVQSGDHILVTDSVYAPTRFFCNDVLKRMGVETSYYDPLIGGDITSLIKENTRLIFTESPGSHSFEMQDIPAISKAAHNKGILVMMDNTWATPLFCKSFDLGVDISVHAGTKYIVGHSDAMLGLIVTTEACYEKIKETTFHLGQCSGPDDVYLAQRGLRTMAVRLRQHQESGLEVAKWLQQRPEVSRVLHPALPEDPGYALWSRDMTGASGLFSIVLNPVDKAAVNAMVNDLDLYGIGYSWGGYESLILPSNPSSIRTATKWAAEGPLLRLHIGLEDTDDLIRDLESGFERMSR
ncbi:cystathionine beta-lyase [Kiloniella laminariae]|uniref:cystathionine beta-lyase n=1 Tax=Kiloniella laminariae TaxID=454162 RepID=UPI0003616242|nr:cystathionine beta-lyase [Kiloniella laminariae]